MKKVGRNKGIEKGRKKMKERKKLKPKLWDLSNMIWSGLLITVKCFETDRQKERNLNGMSHKKSQAQNCMSLEFYSEFKGHLIHLDLASCSLTVLLHNHDNSCRKSIWKGIWIWIKEIKMIEPVGN